MQILLLGMNHTSAPVEIRERAGLRPEESVRAARELRAGGMADEVVVLSTCNRTEIYTAARGDARAALDKLTRAFAALLGLATESVREFLYSRRGADVVAHLFRVAAGLDSMLLGEAEILGQVREAYRTALEAGQTGPVLNRLFQSALEAGKRVRAETDLGTRPMSVAFAAVKLAERIFGKLASHRALILGAGEMGEQLVQHLCNRGIGGILVANRSRERGEELAARYGGEAFPWEEIAGRLAQPEIVITSVGASGRILTMGEVTQAMAARENRPLFLIDLGVPRNVDPAAGELYNVYLYNIDDLHEIVAENRRARQKEIPRAEAIVVEQAAKLETWREDMAVMALLNELRSKLEHEREEFLRARVDQLTSVSEGERARLAELTRQLLDRLVAEPAGHLRDLRAVKRRRGEYEAARALLGPARERT